MNLLSRLLRRLRFRRSISSDESGNVVDGMVKARLLYKRLSVLAHPDKHPDKTELAQELMTSIVAKRYNHAALVQLEKEVVVKLLQK